MVTKQVHLSLNAGILNELRDHAVIWKLTAMNGLLAIYKFTVDVNVEDTTSAPVQLYLC